MLLGADPTREMLSSSHWLAAVVLYLKPSWACQLQEIRGAQDLLAAVSALHAQGLYHLALSPQSVWLRRDGNLVRKLSIYVEALAVGQSVRSMHTRTSTALSYFSTCSRTLKNSTAPFRKLVIVPQGMGRMRLKPHGREPD